MKHWLAHFPQPQRPGSEGGESIDDALLQQVPGCVLVVRDASQLWLCIQFLDCYVKYQEEYATKLQIEGGREKFSGARGLP